MNVKICLERRLVMDLSLEQQAETSLLAQFDGISLETIGLECPFCGELLERGKCSCKEYKIAYQKNGRSTVLHIHQKFQCTVYISFCANRLKVQ